MIITTIMSGIVIPTATLYMIVRGADVMFKEIAGKEKPITVIKLKEWRKVAQ